MTKSELTEDWTHVAMHFSEHMPTDRDEYADLPRDVLVFGQVPRGFDLEELEDYARETTAAAAGRLIVNFEHSAAANNSEQSVGEAEARAEALSRGGWRYTFNSTTPKSAVLGVLRRYDHTPAGIDAAWDELELALPGIERLSRDTITYPGLAPTIRIDLIPGASTPNPGPYHWNETPR